MLWVMITPNKLTLVKIRLQKVVMGEVYTQKVQENFKKCSFFNTIGGPLRMSHTVFVPKQTKKKCSKIDWCRL